MSDANAGGTTAEERAHRHSDDCGQYCWDCSCWPSGVCDGECDAVKMTPKEVAWVRSIRAPQGRTTEDWETNHAD